MGSLLYLPVIWLVATSWLLFMTTVVVPDSVAIQNLKVDYLFIIYYTFLKAIQY